MYSTSRPQTASKSLAVLHNVIISGIAWICFYGYTRHK